MTEATTREATVGAGVVGRLSGRDSQQQPVDLFDARTSLQDGA